MFATNKDAQDIVCYLGIAFGIDRRLDQEVFGKLPATHLDPVDQAANIPYRLSAIGQQVGDIGGSEHPS